MWENSLGLYMHVAEKILMVTAFIYLAKKAIIEEWNKNSVMWRLSVAGVVPTISVVVVVDVPN